MGERVAELEAFADSVADEGLDAVVLLGMGGSSLAPEVLRRTFARRELPRARHDAPGGDPRARETRSTSSARSSSRRRSRARRSRRARTPTTSGSAPASAARPSSRSPIPAPSSSGIARASAASATSSRASRRSAAATPRSRRSGSCPAALMGVDVARLLASADRMAERLPPRRRQSRLRARPPVRHRLAGGPRQDLHRGDRGRLRALGGAADRGVDRQAGQGPRAGAGRVARRPRPPGRAAADRRSVRARRRVLPLGVRGRRRRRRSSRSTRSTSPTCRRRRTRRTRCSPPARSPSVEPRGLDRRAARAGAGARLRLRPGVRRAGRARTTAGSPTSSASCARAAGSSSPTATARATCTRPGSCTRAARTPASSSRSSTTPATRYRFPASRSASAACFAPRPPETMRRLQERGRRVARIHIEEA